MPEAERIVQGRQIGLGKALRDVNQNGGRFGEDALIGYKGGNPALGIDLQVFRLALFIFGKVEALGLKGSAEVLQRDMGGKGAGAVERRRG